MKTSTEEGEGLHGNAKMEKFPPRQLTCREKDRVNLAKNPKLHKLSLTHSLPRNNAPLHSPASGLAARFAPGRPFVKGNHHITTQHWPSAGTRRTFFAVEILISV